MIDLENLPRHPIVESMVEELTVQADADESDYFRVITAFYLCKVASAMRVCVQTQDRGTVPVNCYAVAFAPSGFSKSKTVNYFEKDLIAGFKKRFSTDSFPTITDRNLWVLASEKAALSGKAEEEEKDRLDTAFRNQGPYLQTMRGATAATIQQMRGKLLLSSAGAITIQVDEIGNNIEKMAVAEALDVFLELFDKGYMEVSGTKHTSDNIRLDELDGFTPANLLMFGVPSKLFDGASSETAFMELLDSGGARRLIYAWGKRSDELTTLTPEEIFDRLAASRQSSKTTSLKNHFTLLADPTRHGWMVEEPTIVGYKRTAYELLCKERARAFPIQDDIRRSEMEHRYWKVIKIAGALAFLDESLELTMDHLLQAIGIVEESGRAFERMLNRDKPHVRLAKYLATCGKEVTHADMIDELPYYKSGGAKRKELMSDAKAWGHKNNIIIRTKYDDGIEIFSGETLQDTDLQEMIFSYSDHQAYGYTTEPAPFDKLHMLAEAPDLHWTNHRFESGHRLEQNAIPGFNMIVVDVDGATTLDFVHEALRDLTFMTYTTKRHTPDKHRFRLVMPISYILELDRDDYHDFMNNVLMWLPFESDTSARQRSKKWLTSAGTQWHLNEAKILDPRPFIPKTSKNDQYHKEMQALGSLDNLERWFAQRMVEGDRNNQLLKYALALVDSGMSFIEVEKAVLSFNARLANGLPESRLRSSVLVTAAKKAGARGKQAA